MTTTATITAPNLPDVWFQPGTKEGHIGTFHYPAGEDLDEAIAETELEWPGHPAYLTFANNGAFAIDVYEAA